MNCRAKRNARRHLGYSLALSSMRGEHVILAHVTRGSMRRAWRADWACMSERERA